MLEIRSNCENCKKALPIDSTEAMICTFECTFCISCVEDILQNVCPNCSGGFEKRPVRPKKYLEKYPPQSDSIHKPIEMEQFSEILEKNKMIKPSER